MQSSRGITRVGIPLHTGVDSDATLTYKVRSVIQNMSSQFWSSISTMIW
jgi:hypothetical protein